MIDSLLEAVKICLVDGAAQILGDEPLHLERNSKGVHSSPSKRLRSILHQLSSLLLAANNQAWLLTSIDSFVGQM